MLDYIPTINYVQRLLIDNDEWNGRYEDYINGLNDDTLNKFKEARKQFNVPEPFHLYMPLALANQNARSKSYIKFDLRFHGHSVATIRVSRNRTKDVFVSVKATIKILNTLIEAGMSKDAKNLESYSKKGYFDWHGSDAADFRRIYSELEKSIQPKPSLTKILGNPEHDMECELLKNYSKKSSDGKEILNIQPVMMGETNARFQMPTPIKASEAKSGLHKISYSGANSGNIDILARVGSGKGTKLAVLELKDSYTKNEPAEKVMHQAITYAVFIRELLRSECGDNWWKFFGFGGDIPKKLEIKAIVVMPDYPNADTSFGGVELPIGNDVLKLGYIYRADDPANQKICI